MLQQYKSLITILEQNNVTVGEKFENQGSNSIVLVAQINGKDCIAKFISVSDTNIDNEVSISTIASQLGVGPKIFFVFNTGEKAVIIMERYKETLKEHLIRNNASIVASSISVVTPITVVSAIDKYAIMLEESLKILHTNGIVHNDLMNMDNILCSDDKLVISDFGCAVFSADEDLIAEDLWYLKRTQRMIHYVRNGIKFSSWDDLLYMTK